MIRVTFALPDQDAWIFDALTLAQKASRSSGPMQSKGQIIRDILIPALRGRNKHAINYRHMIDWLVRKPGAFANCVYREELFPTSRFRIAYDALRESHANRCDQEYLGILYLAARQSETAVDEALRTLLANDQPITQAAVESMIQRAEAVSAVAEVTVEEVDLSSFDELFLHKEVWNGYEGGCDGEVDGLLAGAALADATGVF